MDASSTQNNDPPEEPPPGSGASHPEFEIELSGEEQLQNGEEEMLLDAARMTLLAEHVRHADISIAVVDNETIHDLNRRYLQHDYATDVLSFLLDAHMDPQQLEAHSAANAPRGVGKTLSGEVILSAEMAREQAAEFGWRGQDELVLYLVHGLLHLCGYDDLTPPEREIMRQREQSILSTWNLTPHYADSVADAGDPPLESDHGGSVR